MAPTWVDSHCHLDFPVFDADRDAVLARARAAGVTDIVVPSVAAAGWLGVLRVAGASGVHAALGLHPWWTDAHRPEHLTLLRDHLVAGRVAAIGECGLDFARDIDPERQRYWFMEQLRLAADFGLPVIVHAVRALDAVLHTLAAFPGLAGVIHGFNGSRQQAERCVAAGLMLGIGPAVARSQKLQALVRDLPAACLLLETDAPDRPLAGSRGEPADVVPVGRMVAEIRHMEAAALAAATAASASRLFAWGRGDERDP
jgi:TatD DNase family protein